MTLTVRAATSAALTKGEHDAVVALCSAAYEEPFAAYLRDIGPGVHLLGYQHAQLVSHVMWVDRTMRIEGMPPMRTAYIEAVATRPAEQGRGHASALLRHAVTLLEDFDLAMLSPSDAAFYERLGWVCWRGPLSIRDPNGAVVPTPEEEVMMLPLTRTPAALDLTAPLETDWRPGEVW